MGETILFALFALVVVINALFGLVRGLNKSVIRVMLIAVAVLLTYLIAGPVTTLVTNSISIEGQSMGELIMELVNADGSMDQFLAAAPLLKEVLLVAPAFFIGIVVFPVVFGLLKSLTWIVYMFTQKPLRKLIFKENRTKAEYKELPKKTRLINRFSGLGVGIVTGVIIFGMIVTPVFGVFGMLPSADAMNNVIDTMAEQNDLAAKDVDTIKDLYATTDGALVSFYGAFGAKAAGKAFLDSVTRVEVDGVKTSFGAELGTLLELVQTMMQSKLMDALKDPEAIGALLQDKETLGDLLQTAFRSEVLSDAVPGLLVSAIGVPEELAGAATGVFGTLREELQNVSKEAYEKEIDAIVSLCTEFTTNAGESPVDTLTSLFNHAEQSDVIHNTLVGISDSNPFGVEIEDAAEREQMASVIAGIYEQSGKTERDQATAKAMAALFGVGAELNLG